LYKGNTEAIWLSINACSFYTRVCWSIGAKIGISNSCIINLRFWEEYNNLYMHLSHLDFNWRYRLSSLVTTYWQ
jgi:hypothetical protein